MQNLFTREKLHRPAAAAASARNSVQSNSMAKGGDKRRLEQNAAHLRKLQLLIAGANVSWDVAEQSAIACNPLRSHHLHAATSSWRQEGYMPSLLRCLQAAYLLIRLVLRRSSAGKLLYVGWALTGVVYAACYRSISGALCELWAVAVLSEFLACQLDLARTWNSCHLFT